MAFKFNLCTGAVSSGTQNLPQPSQPTQPSQSLEFELVGEEAVLHDVWGNHTGNLGHVVKDGQMHPLDKVYRIKGSNPPLFVLGSSTLK